MDGLTFGLRSDDATVMQLFSLLGPPKSSFANIVRTHADMTMQTCRATHTRTSNFVLTFFATSAFCGVKKQRRDESVVPVLPISNHSSIAHCTQLDLRSAFFRLVLATPSSMQIAPLPMAAAAAFIIIASAAITTTEAFAPTTTTRMSAVSRRSSSVQASAKPLTELCEITKEACDAVSPMLLELYSQIKIGTGTSDTAAFKSDATFFTIADGIVQHMFIEHLFAGNKFYDIVGEEDDSVVNIMETPYTVDNLVVPEEFEELITNTLHKVKALAARIDPTAYADLTIFLDPIDGTREFATGKGDKVTILVGYNDANGVPQAGIVYRPLTTPATWASGAKSEGFTDGVLDLPDEPNPKGVLITDGKVSPFIRSTIENSGMNMVPSLASGNRVLMLVEGKAGAYIRDTGGFAKWDTSGPQAVLEAYGGIMAKLPAFLVDKTMISYTHKKTKLNLDFGKRSVGLTLSNARDKSMFIPGLESIVTDVHLVKEYSCVQGLVALAPTKMDAFYLNAIHSAMNNIKKEAPPMYT